MGDYSKMQKKQVDELMFDWPNTKYATWCTQKQSDVERRQRGMHVLYCQFLHDILVVFLAPTSRLQICLHGDRYRTLGRLNGRVIRPLLKNRTSLVQAALVHRLDFGSLLHCGQERSLVASTDHFETDSSPEPARKTLHHSSNKDRKRTLISSGNLKECLSVSIQTQQHNPCFSLDARYW